MRARSLLVPAFALALALAACGGDDGGGRDGDDGSESSLIPAESTEAPATDTSDTPTSADASTASTTAPPSEPTAFAPSAQEAIEQLRQAWAARDQTAARAIAPGEVVDALFVVDPAGFETYGCDTGEFETSTCNFRNRSTEAFIIVTAARSEAGWQVSTIDVNAN